MAEVAKPTRKSTISSLLLPPNCRQSGLIVGENIDCGDLVYVKSDGLIWRANGTALNAAARVRGVASIQGLVAQKDALTICHGTEISWVNTLTPGADLFLSSAVPGGFSTTATTGGVNPVGYVMDANRFFIFHSS